MPVPMQLSGSPRTSYKGRFIEAASGLKDALELLGCEVGPDGTGMAYIVYKDGTRIGGPSSCMENAMAAAIYRLRKQAA